MKRYLESSENSSSLVNKNIDTINDKLEAALPATSNQQPATSNLMSLTFFDELKKYCNNVDKL